MWQGECRGDTPEGAVAPSQTVQIAGRNEASLRPVSFWPPVQGSQYCLKYTANPAANAQIQADMNDEEGREKIKQFQVEQVESLHAPKAMLQ